MPTEALSTPMYMAVLVMACGLAGVLALLVMIMRSIEGRIPVSGLVSLAMAVGGGFWLVHESTATANDNMAEYATHATGVPVDDTLAEQIRTSLEDGQATLCMDAGSGKTCVVFTSRSGYVTAEWVR